MHGVYRPTKEPLEGHSRYEKVKNLNQGSYGFVQVRAPLTLFQWTSIRGILSTVFVSIV